MRTCRLRTAFGQQDEKHTRHGTPATMLGQACHEALDELVQTGALRTNTWEEATESAWEAAIARVLADANETGPAELAGYQIKRVRLRQVAGRVRELLLAPEAEGADVITEQTLEGAGGRLFGRPDLIIFGPSAHRIIDYKTGQVVDREGGGIKAAYARQLQLYCYLEHERSGSWPATAHLLPFSGPAVEVQVSAQECTAVADEALTLLDAYNSAAPGAQPPAPAAEACGYCPYAARCTAFWAACDATWRDHLVAAAGTVQSVFQAASGHTTLRLSADGGNAGTDEVVLWNISADEHPQVSEADPGSWAGAVGMHEDTGRGVFTLPPWANLHITAA
jgi:RecB family exonuclease